MATTKSPTRGFRELNDRYSAMLDAGELRGGHLPEGGITWLDWVEEFVDSDELPPQIVGHTSRAGPARKGRSWCLDGEQTCYGILDGNDLEVRFADESGRAH